jgi:hypothetical protein
VATPVPAAFHRISPVGICSASAGAVGAGACAVEALCAAFVAQMRSFHASVGEVGRRSLPW